jgi:hypothetical protein
MAEAMFRSGRELMAAGNYARACPKFAESNRIDPKLGTLMNLALCHEKTGKTASAWAEYAQAGDIARRMGQAERERVARERAKALEPTLSRLIIDASEEPGAAVTLDDEPLRSGAFGIPIPLDPGDHVVRATAAGKKPFVESFAVQAGASQRTVHIPALAVDDATQGTTARVETTPQQASPVDGATFEPAPANGTGSRRTFAWVLGGAGVAMVGVGTYFGVRAFSEKSTVENECDRTMRCTPAGVDAKSALSTSETISTAAILGGVAAIGAGVYLWVSGGSHDSRSAQRATGLRVGPDFKARGLRMELIW